MDPEIVTVKETPEQAVDAISKGLDFLRAETKALGMIEASKAIEQASELVKEWEPPRTLSKS